MKNTTLLGVSIFVLTGLPMIAAGQAPPAVVSLSTEIKRIVLVRLKYDTDLLEGLQEASLSLRWGHSKTISTSAASMIRIGDDHALRG
jgi:hypothetical protein